MNLTIPIRSRSLSPVRAVLAAFILLAAPAAARADDLKDGKTALQAGRLDDAEKSFERAAGQGLAEGRAGVGLVWLRRHQFAKATEQFKMAEKMDPNLAMPWYGEGEVQRQQENCEAAVPLLQKATDIDRKFPEAQLSLSDCLTKLKRYDQAIAAANKGLGWGPKWRPKFLVALGNVEMARDSLHDAGTYFTKAREESPDDPLTHTALADFYARRGTFELAYPEYQAAVALDSTDVEVRFALAQALYYGKRYGDALDEYRAVVRRDPDFPRGQLGLGNLLYLSGKADPRRYADRFTEARPPLEKYTQLVPNDPKGWSLLGRTYYFLKMKDESKAALDKAEKLGDKSKEMYTIRARLETERKEYDAALADYRKGDPEPEDMLRLAQIYAIQKNTAAGDSLYRSIIAYDSTSNSAKFALNELGKLRFRDKDYPAAIDFFQRRIRLDPNNDEAYYYIGLSYKEMKQYDAALTALRQAAALADTKADRHFWLGLMYAQLDSVALARQELDRAVKLDSTHGQLSGIALRQLGYYQLLDKKYAEAVPLLQQASEIMPTDVQTWVWLGQGFQNSGNRAKAIEAYDKALAINPNQPDALKGKKSLQGGAAKQGG